MGEFTREGRGRQANHPLVMRETKVTSNMFIQYVCRSIRVEENVAVASLQV